LISNLNVLVLFYQENQKYLRKYLENNLKTPEKIPDPMGMVMSESIFCPVAEILVEASLKSTINVWDSTYVPGTSFSL
jgi:hypothetical protein